MVAKVRAWWSQLDGIGKGLRAALGIAVLLYGGVLGFDRVYQLPAQVDDLRRRVIDLEEFKRFQGCWMLEQSEGRDPNPCRYLLENPDEFRPPFNGTGP